MVFLTKALQKAVQNTLASDNLLDRLFRRSLLGGVYPESDEYRNKVKDLLERPQSIYAGFDATSSSLHIGNLATLMNLIHFQRAGHQVICVIGDATAQVGDPSGHYHDRVKLERSTIRTNVVTIEETLNDLFFNHLDCFAEKNEADVKKIKKPIILKNSQWYEGKDVIDFVGDIFREVRVGGLLHKKSIAERLNSPVGMNMSEFCYQIFQAYDWLQLRSRYNCHIQLGGADQGGNIYTGHDLIKKMTGKSNAIGLLAPLITNESGKKLGKTSDNSSQGIWLHRNKTSPYQLYQYFHRVPDKEVEKLLKVLTLLDEDQIEDLIYNHLKKPEDTWYCQRKLAEQVCLLVHGKTGLNRAKRITHAFHNKNPLDIAQLSDEDLEQLFEGDSIIKMMHRDGMTVLDLIKRANCFANTIEAERLVGAGGLWLNNARCMSINLPITQDLIIGNDVTIMRVGKRNYFLFKWTR